MQVNPFCTSTGNSVSVTADGIKTYAELFNTLFGMIDINSVDAHGMLSIGAVVYPMQRRENARLRFSGSSIAGTTLRNEMLTLSSSSGYARAETGTSSTTFSDMGSSVPSSGVVITFFY